MFKPNTVFVVGAGASTEFGLPLGWQLSQRIVENLSPKDDGTPNVVLRDLRAERLLKRRYASNPDGLQRVFEAATLIQKGLPHAQSIDSFIDMHADKPEVAIVGKLQIALQILRAEGASSLMVDPSNIYNRIKFTTEKNSNSWLRVFAEILLEKARATDPATIGKGVTIICFNYDRCIEHYLIQAIEATLGLPFEKAHEIVYAMNILHPYGSLGKLPHTHEQTSGTLRFGADPDESPVDVWSVAERISTFTEEMKDRDQLTQIHEALMSANVAVFLGFGFQSQNVQLLTPEAKPLRVAAAISTGVGIKEVALREVRGRIARILSGATMDREREAIMLNTGCSELLRDNRLTLSAF